MSHIMPIPTPALFSDLELAQFERDGYIIVPRLASATMCRALAQEARAALVGEIMPLEYEADVHYPGAPASKESIGGHTVRRVLRAYDRGALFRNWAAHPLIVNRLRQLMGAHVVLVQAHHNCIMTKQPQFSSETQWHQDIRYWAFTRPALVNVWLALGPEVPENGCLYLLPGTHKQEVASARLDEKLFLRADIPENQVLIREKITARLNAGDVLFFHARTFHAAGRNQTGDTKFSLVFSYHGAETAPLPGSRSAALPEIPL